MQQLNPEWARVFLQAVSILVSIAGIVALVWQIRKTGQRVADASARFWWAQLRSERQQMEADVTKIDIEQGDLERRREQLAKGIYRVSLLSQLVESRYPDAFPDWFKEEADAKRDSPPVA
ncbi:MAG: hypothetical protein E3J21_07270 [Anaerolineales bacterium]|nr:MAG: hypothetical protein E3J21_07270 [Anaerolineales bacterium]